MDEWNTAVTTTLPPAIFVYMADPNIVKLT